MDARNQVWRSFRVQVSFVILVALSWSSIGLAQVPPQTATAFDKDRRFVQNVKDLTPLRGEADDHDEYDAYNELVLHANKFTVSDLHDAARLDVSYGDLFAKSRADYRFELIQFSGRLKRLKKIEPNNYLKENGVTELYEAWIFPANGTDPLCWILTEKPAGIEPREEYNPSYPVKGSGYFFKLFEYQSKEPSEKTKGNFLTRRAPLMVSKSLTVGPAGDNDGGGPWREVFLPVLLTSMCLFTFFVFGVTWYFRRGDRRSIRILESKKANPFQQGGNEIPD